VVTRDDAKQLQDYLIENAASDEQEPRRLRAIAFDWCRDQRLEPPANDRIDRLIAAALHVFEAALFEKVSSRLAAECLASLDALLDTEEPGHAAPESDADSGVSAFSRLKADAGRVGLASVKREIEKLALVEKLQLPDDLFRDILPKTLERYRRRAATESVWQMRRHPETTRRALLAAFCWRRRQEIIDGLVDLLVQIVHRVSVGAEKTVKSEILGELEKVEGKASLLFRLAEAALGNPEGMVREVLFPVIGEGTLQSLVNEYHAKGPSFRRQVYTLIRRSYRHHYRRMLPLILTALRFRSNNSAHRPVIEALDWLRGHGEDRRKLILCTEVPIDGVVRPQLQEILVEAGPDGERISRIDYEVCALQVLRERLRVKEIWVEGADRYRDPDADLPADFETKRSEYYRALEQPLAVESFIEQLQQAMRAQLSALDAKLPENPKVCLRPQGKKRILVSPLEPQPEPVQLLRLKTEVGRRWPMTSLLDVLKEADLRIGFTDAFKSLASREILDHVTLQHRLLLCLYGLGTNTGLKRMVSSNHDVTYPELLYIRRRFIEKSALREAIRRVVNASFAVRVGQIWGEGTTACASDGKKFGAWD
jgi:hypothetical protein